MTRGTWIPSRDSATSWVRLLVVLQAALRGTDYLANRPDDATDDTLHGVIAAAPLPVWGALLYGAALIVIIGFAGRWVTPVVVGHALLAALYVGIGASVLGRLPGGIPLVVYPAAAMAGAGAYLLLSHRVETTLVRLAVAVPAMLLGQATIALALGSNYRLGTGLLISGGVHVTLAVSALLRWKRTELAQQVVMEGSP